MITTRLRRRAVVLALTFSAALLPAAATSAASSAPVAPATASAPAPAVRTAAFRAAPANSCPRVENRLFAAADARVDPARITPDPVWRTDCRQLYRSDGRGPEVVFEEGFHPKAPLDGQYDIEKYVLVNQASPYVSTTYDHDLYKSWKSGWNYYVDAPGGVDVNKTIGDAHKYASQVEVAFPGGVAREFIVGVCPVDRVRKTEIMNECQDNPHYRPWRTSYPVA
ncbi:ADP-ribosyltransferase [Streptomyces sp. NPDC020141]|uniref:ADP-ribosyltransferase n=1 Tax=Streptomyces sp. NPDC020141 TaxID=3365065 RepID=UPI00378C1668